MKPLAIAIDGPGGVGKSTSARIVARELGMTYIDTGAMYRAVALYQIESGRDMRDAALLEGSLADICLDIRSDAGGQRIFLNGRDVTEAIRTQEVAEGASVVAANLRVREKLVEQQREMARAGRVVMDGRDIGSHVLPGAQVKIYMDAPPEVRAKRRIRELRELGTIADFDEILAEIISRDHRDKTREHNPLIRTPDAIYLDTSEFASPEDTAAAIVAICKEFQ